MQKQEKFFSEYNSPLGKIIIASDGKALIGLWFEGQKYFPENFSDYTKENLPVFEETTKWLDLYFRGVFPNFTPQIKLDNSNFRLEVWNLLKQIPFGKTTTYGEISKIIAQKRGLKRICAQAVGGAVGHNPISIIIPCHRVIGKNKNLTGYAGGIERKIKLLELEGIDTSEFTTHTNVS